ncbi:uncharacterized protein LOC122620139 [Drosophila teissieri]|uniref:uncharacterized protein LOC122620139 n=1 Tax=Drosophila teissieri TaxID=7243 RepID=UPI001CB9E59E|nr:uncharacterized protein LOC122620139 [Drosophila teissieri]
MIYFKFSWLLVVVLLFISSQNACAARKRKGWPKITFPKIKIDIHHNNIHIG